MSDILPSYKKLHIREENNVNSLRLSCEQWNQVLKNSPTNTIFQTYSWFKCWWNIFGDGRELLFLTAYDNDRLVGFAPLMITPISNSLREIRFVGDGNADYLDFIISEQHNDVITNFLNYIKANVADWHRIVFNNIPEQSLSPSILKTLPNKLNMRSLWTDDTICPYLLIDDEEHHALKIANKYSTKRPYNAIKKRGLLNFRNISDENEAHELLDLFFEQHITRWENTSSPSLFRNIDNRLFYRSLIVSMLKSRRVIFSVVEFNNDPISFHFGFDYNRVLTWYKPSYSTEYADKSPGVLLIRYLILYAIENKHKELDFTIGDETFKSRFTTKKRKNTCFRIYNHPGVYFYEFTRGWLNNKRKRLLRLTT
jgi:CelD/BcsL family acetyltransferase involved in cellulose biosynthesis